MLNLWVSRFYVKSVSYTIKHEASMSKICPFSQPQLSQVVLSCFFFQIVNPSVISWLGGIFVILRASDKHTLLFWPFPCTKTSPEVHFFGPRRILKIQLHARLFSVEEIPKQQDVLVMLTIRRENSESKLRSWLLLTMPFSINFASLFNR